MSASKTTLVAVLVIALTFVAGAAVGMFSAHMIILHGGPGAEMFPTTALVNRLDRRLDLSDAQRAQVEAIIRRRHARMNAIWSSTRPRIRTEIEGANAEITRVLTPEQRVKFDRMKFHLSSRLHR